jgi:hypothetical protein
VQRSEIIPRHLRPIDEMPSSLLMRVFGPCYISIMAGIRTPILTRWSRGLIAACLACLLAFEALITSVGFGMSAAPHFGQPLFDICRAAAAGSLATPAPNDDKGQPGHQPPQCPFCFVAAQSASHPAIIADAKSFPLFAVRDVAVLPHAHANHRPVHGPLHRTTGDPRGPPSFSV